jgi:hypothetical protein
VVCRVKKLVSPALLHHAHSAFGLNQSKGSLEFGSACPEPVEGLSPNGSYQGTST